MAHCKWRVGKSGNELGRLFLKMFKQLFHITVPLPINYNIVWYHGKDYMKGEVVWGHTPPRVFLAILRLRSDL